MTPGEQACNDLKVTLKEYFESKLSEVERRLVSLNDLNKFMAEDRAKFVTRELHDKLAEDLKDTQLSVTKLNSRILAWTSSIALFDSVIIGILVYHLNK